MATNDRFSRLAALRPARAVMAHATDLRNDGELDGFARHIGATVAANRYGEHLRLNNWFSTPEFREPSSAVLELLSSNRDASLSRKMRCALEDPAKWLFLDTETTGLSGGAGTYAFLVGLAWWDATGLHVEQMFMRDFTEEHSILYELSSRLAQRPVLVTFNGKSFDWPLLEGRYAMTRSIPAPLLAAHLDLLYPARAVWKLRLRSVRLVELERHVLDAKRLGWHREDDVLSSLIPQHYFDYLRGGTWQPLAAVLRHNQMDLRGLAALLGKIDALLASGSRECEEESVENEADGLDLFGLSRYLQRRGDSARAQSACARAIHLGLPVEVRPQARQDLAMLAKRRGDHEAAAALWHDLVTDAHAASYDGVRACEQLSIHYERRVRDISRAVEFALLALAKVKRVQAEYRKPYAESPATFKRMTRVETRLLRRANRLEVKLRRSLVL